ncbi:MAG: peptidoglycan-binding protein [Fibrobacterota bacterium]
MTQKITIDIDTQEGLPIEIKAGKHYTITLKTNKLTVDCIEVPDILFNHNSAVPCIDSNGWLLESAATVFNYVHNNENKELVIFGHTDRSGEKESNFELSEMRSKAYLSVLKNDVDAWKEITEKSKTEDYQAILKTLSEKHGWNCDPGEITNDSNEQTKEAVTKFQSGFNRKFNQDITIDGIVGPQTWVAFLDTYRYYIESAVKSLIETETLPEITLGYKGMGVYPCGECMPKSEKYDYRSQRDRRVELFFYEKGKLTDNLSPPSADRNLSPDVCPITNFTWLVQKVTEELIDIIADANIEIVSSDSHFAPGAEEMDIKYRINNCEKNNIYLEVSSDSYPENILFKEPVATDNRTDGEHTIHWNGKTNCEKGPLAGLFINPLYGPYKVRLYKDEAVFDEKEFHIYIHSLTLHGGTYTENGSVPDKNSELIKWIQYKLNYLGYFSGPIDGIKGEQTRRAMRRYTYKTAGYYGHPPRKEIDDENDSTLLQNLEKDTQKVEIFENGKFPDSGESVKAYIEHDYFYRDTATKAEFGVAQGHCKKDEDKLDRFELPVQCSVLLVSKSDPDGSGVGVAAAGGSNDLDVEWEVIDPAEDTTFLPNPTADIPFKGKAYIEDALSNTRNDASKDGNDNCPCDNNYGQRKNNGRYFRTGDKLKPYMSKENNGIVLSKVFTQQNGNCPKDGTTGILFRGSYIAGDNYIIAAQVYLKDNEKDKNIKALHEKFFGTSFEEKFSVESGMFTLWRKQHIAAVVNWPDPGRGIKWNDVALQYRLAHCELDPVTVEYKITDLFSTNADKQAYLNLVQRHYGYAMKDMAFDENGLYPRKIRPQGPKETPGDYEDEIYDTVEMFSDGPNSSRFLDDLSEMLFEKVRTLRPAGAIVLRPNWCREYIIKDPADPTYSQPYIPAYYCYGGSNGMVLMDNPMTGDEQDGFLFGHEIGHCRFLLHHETSGTGSDNPDEHDINDHNCIMCYPDGIASRPGLTWNKGDTEEPRLCGKCILKMRGWDNTDKRLPASS